MERLETIGPVGSLWYLPTGIPLQLEHIEMMAFGHVCIYQYVDDNPINNWVKLGSDIGWSCSR
jgi:hypothetical protein